MKTLVLAAAVLALTAGVAGAAPKAKGPSALVGPEQPIPYGQLKAYSAASTKAKATKDWWTASAQTGSATDIAASVAAIPIDTPTPPASAAASPKATPAPPSSRR